MSQRKIEKLAMKVDSELEEQRCPRCGALLFRADADGQVEIKCRKCGHMIKRTLSRVTGNRPLTGSPTEGQGQSKSPKRPIAERWGNDLGK
jgi:phage FluMu protein Com